MTKKHSGTRHHGEAPFGSLDGLRIAEEAGRLVEIMLGEITDEDILAVLGRCPSRIRRSVLDVVGLAAMKSPTSRAAATVLQRMRHGRGSEFLRNTLASTVDYAFRNCDGLSVADCVMLLSGDPDGAVLGRARTIVYVLIEHDDHAQRLLRWSLSRAIAQGAELAAVALGLLHASRNALGPEGAAIVQAGWAELREREVLLPEKPVSAALLSARALALRTDADLQPPDTGISSGTSGETTDDVEDETMVDTAQPAAATPGHLGDLLRSARTSFATAAEAAGRALLAFQSERRPDGGDLAQITDAVLDFDALRAAITQLTREPADESLGRLQTAVESLSLETTRDTRIRALMGIRGPGSIEDLLERIRSSAATGSPAELHLLTDLIGLAADGDDARIDGLSETAREKLPREWSQVITAAVRGRLRLDPVAMPARPAAEAIPAPPLVSPETAVVRPVAGPEPEPVSATLDDLDLLLLQDAATRERRARRAEVSKAPSIDPSAAAARAPEPGTDGSPEDNGGRARPQSTESPSIPKADPGLSRAAEAEVAALRSVPARPGREDSYGDGASGRRDPGPPNGGDRPRDGHVRRTHVHRLHRGGS
jgi:hypothetical protein